MESFLFGIATNLATDLLKSTYRGGRNLGLGTPEHRALTRAFTRAFQALAAEVRRGSGTELTRELAALVEAQLSRLVTDPVIAEMFLRAARDGFDLDLDRIHERFEELGFDAETFLVDFDTAMSQFQFALADELLDAAGAAGSALFNRLVLARLESMREQMARMVQSAGDEAGRPEGVPAMSAHFVGRDQELRELKERLTTAGAGPQLLTAVRGWPGVGKTTLAARLAKDKAFVAEAFPDGVLWAAVPDASRITIALACWAWQLGLRTADVLATGEQLSAMLAGALRDRRALLVVDDVWDEAHVMPFAVGGPGCAMLITTRLTEVAEALAATERDIYPLELLSEDAAVELLRRLAPDVVEIHPDECRQLVGELERLPLAVQVAGRLLRAEWRNGWGVWELLVALREGSALLAARAPVDRAAPDYTVPTVSALLRKSTDRLDELTRLQFAYLGVFAPKPATFELEDMADVLAVPDPRPTARRLVARGLLEPVGGGRFAMHAVLVFHAVALLREAG